MEGRSPKGWRAVGHQRLVDVVRATGARQPIVLDGLNYGGDLSAWAEYEPTDPLDQLVAGWHIYNFSQCGVESCWDATAGRLSRTTPVLLTEIRLRPPLITSVKVTSLATLGPRFTNVTV